MAPRSLGRLFGAWLTVSSLGCQALLGDFEIEPSPAAPVGLGTTCEPSALRCDGANLETCAADRRGWAPLVRCATAGQCDASAGTCRVCLPGEAACNGSVRQICTPAGELETVVDCETAALCRVEGHRASASCATPTCDAGEFTCDVNRLLRCAPGRDHWDLVARCASGPLCNVTQAADQAARGAPPTCVVPLCMPGSFACDGATLLRCSDDQNAWLPLQACADAASCNPRDGNCMPAADGTTACSGVDLVQKSADGFERIDGCDSPLLCDAGAGECRTSTCGAPGSLRCSDEDLPALEECAGDGTWIVREACDHRALCDAAAGRCFPKACDPDATRCVGPAHQTCSADLTHWETDQTCADGESCTVAGCEPDTCGASAVRCVAESLQVCNAAGRWEPKLHCATEALCAAVDIDPHCDVPVCGGYLGDYTCSEQGEKLLRCNPNRAKWEEFRICVAPTPLCNADRPVAGGLPVCNACEPLAYACDGAALTRCTADGLSSPTIADCPGGCSVSAGIPSCL